MTDQILSKLSLFFLALFAMFLTFSIAGAQISYSFSAILFFILIYRKTIDIKTTFGTPIIIFFITAIFATIFSLSPMDSLYNLKKFLLVPIIFIVPSLIKSRKELKIVLFVFLISANVIALFGIGKYLFTNWTKVIATQTTTMTWGAMSVFFVIGWTAMFFTVKKNRDKIFIFAAIIVQTSALLLSNVRGSYLAVIVGIFIVSLFKHKKILLYFVAVVLVVLMISPNSVVERVKSIPNLNIGSTQLRLNQWRDSIDIFKDYPILGVGWIDLHEVHIAHAPPGADLSEQRYNIGHFHNNFITILMIFGSIGLVVFLWLFYEIIKTEWKIIKQTKADPLLNGIAIFSFAGTIGFLCNGMFDWTFGDEEVVMIFWFVTGLCLAAGKVLKKLPIDQ